LKESYVSSSNNGLSAAGLDFSHQDQSVRPQDDLYRHFNGGWLKTAVIPADRATDGAFMALRDQSEARPNFDAIKSLKTSHRSTKNLVSPKKMRCG
jgi:putative endopeptidase